MIAKMENELKTILRSYGHNYYKVAHTKEQNYDAIDDKFIGMIVELFSTHVVRKEDTIFCTYDGFCAYKKGGECEYNTECKWQR